ncbi:MAG: aldo/keto reductase [Thermosynechococcaceae cyanobacterium MS004]|nr:aldo/keto reductase [Thermosynechococcaceae cyanobacterium MS004]
MSTSRQLGRTGVQVSALGIGTWAWGDKLFWGYGDRYGETDVEEAFQASVSAGITFFDTAEVYGTGESERLLGRFCKTTSSPLQIATKFGPLPWRFTKASVLEAIEASLSRLQMDSIALYQVHWPFSFLLSQPTLFEALAEGVQRGWIQSVGVSNYNEQQMQNAHDSLASFGIPLAVNQVRYSLVTRQIEQQGLLARSRQLGVTLLAYSPLAQGLLTGKYTAQNLPQGARRLDPRFNAKGLTKLAPVLDALKQSAEAHDKTLGQVALNWLIQQENVIPIPGAKNARQAQENAGAIGWALTPDEVEALEQVSRPYLH